MISYRKHGGLRFLSLGRLSISWSFKRLCVPKPPIEAKMPIILDNQLLEIERLTKHVELELVRQSLPYPYNQGINWSLGERN